MKILQSLVLLALVAAACGGCELSSFIDPSKTGRFEYMPTTIPLLERIDVIEHEEALWGKTTKVSAEDLIPSDLSYKLSPGDLITVQIFELYTPTQWHSTSGRVDAGGTFRIPEIGDVQAAGMTAQQFEDRVTRLLDEQVMQDPLVDVIVETAGGFRYTVYGAVAAPGVYTLNSPDLRLLDALAIAGGVPLSTPRIYVIRQVALSEDIKPTFERGNVPGAGPDQPAPRPEIDIESLIEQLGAEEGDQDRTPGEPAVDLEDLKPPDEAPPAIDMDQLDPEGAVEGETFIFDEQRGEWIRVRSGIEPGATIPADSSRTAMQIERVIEIPFQRLKRGDHAYNLVIRPEDRIYIQEAPQGVVYLDGEVLRPGVYNLPTGGGKLTLSRLIAAAGGLSGLAIPERVDLTRRVGDSREATIRLNLGGIRMRTEPDVVLKPDDHIIVGTNFWAFPLAVIRNGFRVTYGYGFLLDRNFGNDVFGAPPSNFNQ